MPNYFKMYHILCSAASEAIDLLEARLPLALARIRLQEALYQAEDCYLTDTEES